MSELETKPAAADEGKTAVGEFLADFKSFKENTAKRMVEMSTMIDAIDRKSADVRRPALATAAEPALPHAKAFSAYVRHGDEEALRALSVEGKGLNTQVAAEGGFLVDIDTSKRIQSVLRSGASIRALAKVVQIEAGSFDVLIDYNDIGAGWQDETGTVSETQAMIVDRISIVLHELSASPTASQRILDDSAFNIEQWLADRIAEKFLRSESDAFVNGDGVNKPNGFLTKTLVPNAGWTWGQIGYVTTGTSGDFDANNPGNALIDLVYSLNAEYRAGSAFIMNSKTAGEVRKMKDNQGRFLWMEGLHAAQPPLLVGYPVLIVEEMPDLAADSHSVAFGNFEQGYTIAERPDLRILRDPYSAKPNVMFYATKRVGGDVSDYAAIKTLKFGTA